MKHIYFVIDSLTGGGAERVASVLANEMVQIGHSLTIISKSHKEPFYKLDPMVQLRYPRTKMLYGKGIKRLLEWLKVQGEIFSMLREKRPDLVVSFSTTTNGLMIPICRLLRLKIVACEHNNYKLKIDRFSTRLIKRRIYPHATFLTVLTERDKVLYYSKFMKRIRVMPNPLPLMPVDHINISGRRKMILAVGGLSRWQHKGFDNLLRIYADVIKKNPDWTLEIAGGGDDKYLRDVVSELGLNDHVHFLGLVTDIASLMRQCAIFVLPSRYEGLPMVLIEAMSQGMSCIAFDCFTGPGDIMTNGVDGILVSDQENGKFAEQLSIVIDDPHLRIELGKNAIETSKKYLPEKIMALWTDLIEESETSV